jgi:hypothetical protein
MVMLLKAAAFPHDGRYVAYITSADDVTAVGDALPRNGGPGYQTYVRDMENGRQPSGQQEFGRLQANDDGYYCVMTPDGRFVTFESYQTTWLAGDTNALPRRFSARLPRAGPHRGRRCFSQLRDHGGRDDGEPDRDRVQAGRR